MTDKKNAPAMEGKFKHFELHFTRLALLLLLAASTGAGLALLSVAAVRWIGGAA